MQDMRPCDSNGCRIPVQAPWRHYTMDFCKRVRQMEKKILVMTEKGFRMTNREITQDVKGGLMRWL